MLLSITNSCLAAAVPTVPVLGGCLRLLKACVTASKSYHAQALVAEPSPISILLEPLNGPAASEQEHSENKELLRYSTHFPEPLWGYLTGLVHSRPFPTAIDMSCAALGVAGAELAKRGFQVAEICPPATASGSHYVPQHPLLHDHHHHQQQQQQQQHHQQHLQYLQHNHGHLPGGCSDIVTVLPGPRSLHAPELLVEARRLMANGGFLAVAWNDRDLSSPFVNDLESLLEGINPQYCRSSRQHNPPAVLAALSDGGALRLCSYTSYPHSLSMARAGVLQDLLGGFVVVRPHLAASSANRKAFHQEVRALVRHHFGDEESPFELPLVTKLYVLTKAPSATTSVSSRSHSHNNNHSSTTGQADGASSSSSTSNSCCHGSMGSDEEADGAMARHVRTGRAGGCRDSCALRHLYA